MNSIFLKKTYESLKQKVEKKRIGEKRKEVFIKYS